MTIEKQITFVRPLPGLAPYIDYAFREVDGAAGLHTLRSADGIVRLFLVRIGFERYAGEKALHDAVARLGGEEAEIFAVASVDDDGVHVNLRAPVLISRTKAVGEQVILENAALPVSGTLVA
ncbi:flagellar assembly protein FliW [Microbacterium suaedae]|uniref:flagellar assembly protein FliW n=1 Tax=Microbacterium suaedae TaxID=2067813 RepID=UPI000DA1E5D4|nr:flagellar assembly protein FliW [Microbacterium suaedae]